MIIVRLMGGLGNQLFQYAAGRRLAEARRTKLKLDLSFLLDRTPKENFTFRDFDLPIFNIQENIATDPEIKSYYNFKRRVKRKFFPFLVNPYVKEKFFHFDPSILELSDNCYLDGHWTSDKYFKDIEHILRKELTFKHELSEHSKKLANEIQSVNSICLNVRRGDYVTNPDVVWKIGAKGLDYYDRAIQFIFESVKDPHIFVFTDDFRWAVDNLKIDCSVKLVDESYNGVKYQEKLHLMTLCNHFIIPNSSFAWWAAWLGNYSEKKVIAPKKWFNNLQVDTKDLLPSEWITL